MFLFVSFKYSQVTLETAFSRSRSLAIPAKLKFRALCATSRTAISSRKVLSGHRFRFITLRWTVKDPAMKFILAIQESFRVIRDTFRECSTG